MTNDGDLTQVRRMPYEDQLIHLTKNDDGVTIPDEGVIGRVVSVDCVESRFEFLPNEPDPTRNNDDKNAREFIQWWNDRHGDTRKGWRISGMRAQWENAFYVIDEETDGCL